MQVSTSTQNNFPITLSVTEASKVTPLTPIDTNTQKIDSVNKDAYNYFDLGQDVSKNTAIDPVQEKTNKELVNYLTGFLNNTSPEGKNNLEAFDTRKHLMVFNLADIPTVKSTPLNDLDYTKRYVETGESVRVSVADAQEIPQTSLTKFADGHNIITQEESDTLKLERFKNLYSFSNKFSKTEKFQELFEVYTEKSSTQLEEINSKISEGRQSGRSYFDVVEPKEYITSEIVKNAFSKSEAIEHFANISNEFKELLLSDTNDPSHNIGIDTAKSIQKTIDLYDKITTDLKNMWGFGDIDITV